jgi:hypothetical protein
MTTTTKKTAPAKPAKPNAKTKRTNRTKDTPTTPTKKLSQIEAALAVLKKAEEPLTCKQLVEAMAERKLWASPGGKTPDATLYASITREIATKGNEARFVKAAPGRFAARK